MKNFYDKNTTEDVHKSLFELDFEFEGLTKIESEILRETVRKVTEDAIYFDLFLINKEMQPLNILLKLYTNKTTGDVKIKMHDKDGDVHGIILFKTLKITKINNLIDFDYDETETTEKNINVNIVYDDILYSSDNKEFNKLT